MKQYTHLLFDIDNTILNFDAAEQRALATVLQKYGHTIDQRQLHEVYHVINDRKWRAFERDEMTKETLLNTRFLETFAYFNIEIDGRVVAEEYQQLLAQEHEAIPFAKELLEVTAHIPKYIVTNGVASTQLKRLKDSQFEHYFDAVYVSETVGFHKPQKQFFDTVFMQSPEIQKETTLIIGDSLLSDIKGGNDAGIDTCWFNFYDEKNDTMIEPTFAITSLMELVHQFKREAYV